MKPIYTEITTPSGTIIIKADYGDGNWLFIPVDEANSDYQAYLDRDKPKAALSTPNV
jgi:hypothetical protein